MRLIVTALLLGFLAFAAAAQGVEEKKAELEKLSAQIARIETAVQEKTTDDAALVKLRIDLESFSKAVIDFGVSLRPRLSQINARLEELGPPPQAGEPAEPEQLTQERNALQEEKSIHNSLLSDAETLSIRASQSIDQIGELRRNLFTNTLFQRANIGAAIDRNTWGSFLEEMAVAFHTLTSRIQFMLTFRHTELLLAAGLSILFGIGAYFAVGRTFGAIVRRREEAEEPSYIAKLSLAFWSTVIPSLGVAASLAATFGIFSYMSIFTADTLDLVEALLISCAAIFFIQRLANVLLAPSDAGRRLIMIADAPARMLMVLIQLLAMIHVLDFLFERIFATLSSPLSLTVAKSLISSVAIGIILILIALVKPFRDESTGATLSWPRWIRLPIILVAVFIIAATFIGYIGLARFIATQIVMTGAILATMYIGVQSGHVLADEPVFQQSAIGRKLKTQFSLPDTTLDQISLLLSFLVNIMVILVGLPLILLQWGFNRLDIQTWLYRILTDIQIGTISISIVGIVFGTLVFVVGFFATRRLQRWLDGSVMARSRVDPGVRNSIRTIVGYAGVVLAAMVGLSAAGFDLSSLALVAGALSLGIGFGLQNIVSNFVSGLILLAERPFKVGDWIVAGNAAGFVRKISVRATEIETFQNQTIILPNSELINNPVGNWTHRDHRGRIEIAIGAAYGASPRKVHEILLDVAARNPDVLKKPPPNAVFMGFGESSLDFELRVHVLEVLDSMAVATRLRFEIFEAFEQNKIEIPFPQRDVNLKLPDIEKLADTLEAVKQRRARQKKA